MRYLKTTTTAFSLCICISSLAGAIENSSYPKADRPIEAQKPHRQFPVPKSGNSESQETEVKPFYPKESIRLGEEGEVIVRFILQSDASIGTVKLEKSSGFERLDEAALSAVRRLKGLPRAAIREDQWFVLPVRFKLTGTQELVQSTNHLGKDSPASSPNVSSSDSQGAIPDIRSLVREINERNSLIDEHIAKRANELQLGTVLLPANLVSPDGIQNGRDKLEKYEAELAKSQREQYRLYDEFVVRLKKLAGPSATHDVMLQGIEDNTVLLYERSLRAEESQRRLLSISRQVLSFAEERLGKIKLEENRLIFANISDLRFYEFLWQQLSNEAKVGVTIAQEQQAARDKAVKALSDGSANLTLPSQSAIRYKLAPSPITYNSPSQFWLVPPKKISAESISPCSGKPLPQKLSYVEALKVSIERCFIAPPFLADVAKCEVEIHQSESGKVESTKIGECVGHPLLGDFVERAVLKASPLPRPPDPKAFMPVVRLIFNLNGWASKTLIAEPDENGTDNESLKRRVNELKQQQGVLLQRRDLLLSTLNSSPASEKGESAIPTTNNKELADQAKTMARLEAEIEGSRNDFAKRPRKKFLGARSDEYRFAKYIDDWRKKIERLGTENYPDAARGRLYGSLIMTITIKSDGTLSGPPEINRSSGHKELDDAALKIVEMASPYLPFSQEILRDTDVIVMTQTWNFTKGDGFSPQ